MASRLLQNYSNVKLVTQKKNVHKFSKEDYDATYGLAVQTLKVICLRLTNDGGNKIHLSIIYNMIFWFMMTNLIIATVLESISMMMTASDGTLVELFTMMPCVGYLLVAISKAYKIKRYRPVFMNLVSELRSMWPEGEVDDEEEAIITSALNRLRLVTKAYFSCNFILGLIFILPSTINLIKMLLGFEAPRLLPFFYWLPFDPYQKVVFEVVVIVQNSHCCLAATFMLSGDLLFVAFLSHITTQFSLLALRIEKMFYVPIDSQLPDFYPLGSYTQQNVLNQNIMNDTSNMEKEASEKEELVKIIQFHRSLIRLSNDVEKMYSFSLLVNFLNSSIIICFCLFCCAFVEKWNEFIYKVFFVTAISQIWILCWYGQHLLDTSAGVGEALYNSGWYVSTNKIKKSILIMIHRSQKRVRITTFGFSIVSMESYATILKTSWSYFTLLINVYKG